MVERRWYWWTYDSRAVDCANMVSLDLAPLLSSLRSSSTPSSADGVHTRSLQSFYGYVETSLATIVLFFRNRESSEEFYTLWVLMYILFTGGRLCQEVSRLIERNKKLFFWSLFDCLCYCQRRQVTRSLKTMYNLTDILSCTINLELVQYKKKYVFVDSLSIFMIYYVTIRYETRH